MSAILPLEYTVAEWAMLRHHRPRSLEQPHGSGLGTPLGCQGTEQWLETDTDKDEPAPEDSRCRPRFYGLWLDAENSDCDDG